MKSTATPKEEYGAETDVVVAWNGQRVNAWSHACTFGPQPAGLVGIRERPAEFGNFLTTLFEPGKHARGRWRVTVTQLGRIEWTGTIVGRIET